MHPLYSSEDLVFLALIPTHTSSHYILVFNMFFWEGANMKASLYTLHSSPFSPPLKDYSLRVHLVERPIDSHGGAEACDSFVFLKAREDASQC